ncbi:alpha/beta hydrolase [Iamia majanohamensis]|uniref:Alpha/beta hydrolase n=1 Tax=Iamia majanohamensis TaxID=467976 RepID=A0AAE9Y7P5_9ACTN|nr:alpha/beta hydrolase [Iamia majanohamensis]WCO65958.1 alpha/beta hydrolase [Iamia majanohamensis]
MEVHDVSTARLRHQVAEAGSGVPLLLVHGFTGAKEDFTDVLDAFAAEGWHAVAPDLRGHGASEAPGDESAYSLEVLADDVLALADALGWGAFALLGHSMGGMVAQVLALRAPQRLTRLVLMDTSHGSVEHVPRDLAALALAVVRAEGVERLMELATQVDTPPPTPAEARVRAERPGYVEFGDRKLRASSPAMWAAMATELLDTPDRLPALAGLDVPTLVVVGEEDAGFLAPSQRMAAAIPGARLEVVPDAAHSPQFENPDRWWEVVSGFLAAGREVDA